jgi:hypothetical protein
MDDIHLSSSIEKAVDSAYDQLIGLPDEIVQRRPYEGAWSIKEIIGHLVDSASNNHQRWVRLQIDDGLRFPDYQADNEKWVSIQHYNDGAWDSLLSLWRFFNLHLSAMIRSVDRRCLQNRWVVDDSTSITLDALMADYLRHLQLHLDQVRKVLGSTL